MWNISRSIFKPRWDKPTVGHAGKILGDTTRVFGRLDRKPRMTVSPRVLFYVVVIKAGPCCYTPNINCRRSIYGHGSYYLVCDWSCFRISDGQQVRPSHSSRRPGTNSSNITTNLPKRDLATKYFGDHLFSLPVTFTGSESVTSTNRTRRKRWLILSIRGLCNYRWLYGMPANSLYGRHTISGKLFTFAIFYLRFCNYHVPQNCKLWAPVWEIFQQMTRAS